MTPLLIAVQFLTLSPPFIKRLFKPHELGQAVGYFPLVGLGLGGVLAGLNALLSPVLPVGVRAALVLAGWVMMTGALHLDGFLDACDGLLGGFTPESRMEIMRDERVGAFALAGGVLLLLLKFTALQVLLDSPFTVPGLLVVPALARWAMALAVVIFPYAREKGLGRDMKDHAGRVQVILASLTALAAAWLLLQWSGLLMAVVVLVILWTVGNFVLKRIPGMTGDIYGAVCELSETGVLLVLAFFGAI